MVFKGARSQGSVHNPSSVKGQVRDGLRSAVVGVSLQEEAETLEDSRHSKKGRSPEDSE